MAPAARSRYGNSWHLLHRYSIFIFLFLACLLVCCVVLCYVVLCCLVLSCAVLCCVILSCVFLYCLILCSVFCVVLCCLVLSCAVLCYLVLGCLILSCVLFLWCCFVSWVVLSCLLNIILCRPAFSSPKISFLCLLSASATSVMSAGPVGCSRSIDYAGVYDREAAHQAWLVSDRILGK
jgi:hypothetical protein